MNKINYRKKKLNYVIFFPSFFYLHLIKLDNNNKFYIRSTRTQTHKQKF